MVRGDLIAKRKKKYDPIKEVNKVTGATTAVLLGGHITHSVAAHVPGGAGMVTPPLRMMNVIPVVGAGGSVIRSLEMLNTKPKRRKKRR